jgi:hypothetical protein
MLDFAVAETLPPSLLRLGQALHYLNHLDTVEGWLSPTTALAMVETLWLQERVGVIGDIAEIGVFQGKSFLALAAGSRPAERLVAVDIFDAGDPNAERPDQDVYAYGEGNRAAFLANVAKFFPGVHPVILEGSSASLRGKEGAHGLTNLRMISIDGSHTSAMTYNDLQIADAALGPDGICWLDDVLNPHWMGVISGLFLFLGQAASLVPLAMFPNKLVLCRPAWIQYYRAALRKLLGAGLAKERVELHQTEIDVFGESWPQLRARCPFFNQHLLERQVSKIDLGRADDTSS